MTQAIQIRQLLVFTLLLLVTMPARADEPLHARIDTTVEAAARAASISPAPLAEDAEFLRRIYLDLTGTIPTAAEARAFLASADPGKRQQLIDQLLADDRFPRRMAEALTVMLMERRLPAGKPEIEQFEGYLREAIADGKPINQIVADLLSPDVDDEKTRGSAIFLAKRLENFGQNPVDYPGLTRDVGRLFLGVDLQCAQCHNHLSIREYKQSDYQGLFAFVSHTYLRKDVKFPAVGEKVVDKKIEFASIFAGSKREIGPRVPGLEEVSIPVFEKGQEWIIPPDKKTNSLGVPKFSPLKMLAAQLPTADNERFRRNMANRLWYLMVGRGVVHPLDLHHKDNPPSNEPLLALLAEELVKSNFDLKTFVRQIALSKTYQRSSRSTGEGTMPPAGSFAVAQLKRMSPEQLLHASLVATGEWESVAARKPEPPATKPAVAADADVNEEPESPAKSKSATKPPTLKELREKFVAAFAAPPGELEIEFSPTVAAALFVLNDQSTLPWLQRRDGNLVDRLTKLDDPAKVANELYLSVLTRFPTEEERAEVVQHLREAKNDTVQQREPSDSVAGSAVAHSVSSSERKIGELVWALLASTEFAVNH